MQISRHWRLNPLRYRLEAVRRDDGTVALQERAITTDQPQAQPEPVAPTQARALQQRRAS